jgi:hypothetical protein
MRLMAPGYPLRDNSFVLFFRPSPKHLHENPANPL